MTKRTEPRRDTPKPKNPEPQSKTDQDRKLGKELEMTYPASDPPASTQPGSGITGPEVAK